MSSEKKAKSAVGVKSEIGMIGLGVMGRNLLLNLSDHGYSVAGFDKDRNQIEALQKESKGREQVRAAETLPAFIDMLAKPRALIMLVPAGAPVDSVMHEALPHLQPGDLLIDGGNSYFKDTDLREKSMNDKGLHYLGVGISGGERGARYGPSIMPGGSKEAYGRVAEMLEAAAAHVEGDPCVAYLGPRSAGHYVKMVHNGIEYGLMQLISETYDIMKRGLGMTNDEMHDVYNEWNKEELSSYLLEITAAIFREEDKKTKKRLVDVILDEAKQKGTGAWTSEDAMRQQIPTPTIDLAVSMRSLSILKGAREQAAKLFEHQNRPFGGERSPFLRQLREALFASMILAYSQGMTLLRAASMRYDYGLDLETVARIWRGGCIIRAALLEDIRSAYREKPDLLSLLLDPGLGGKVAERQEALRAVASAASRMAIPAPALMASLAYFDAFTSSKLPANLIQAQRDYFGSHTYERVDAKGSFHTHWE